MATSDRDLRYVRGDGRNIMAQPVFPVDLTVWTARFGAVAQAIVPLELSSAIPEDDKTVSRRSSRKLATRSGLPWINQPGGGFHKKGEASFQAAYQQG